MKCPVCEKDCRAVEAGGVTVEVCHRGCGGIWFDNFELEKVDEAHEAAGEALLDIPCGAPHERDAGRALECPRCSGQSMMRHFFSVKRQVQVDVCPECGGTWLDFGELAEIREQFGSESARRKAAEQMFDDLFSGDLAELRSESSEGRVKARRLARIFRFLCPSYYMPGKQTWGAF
jgi:Zn-finger nucleic acid-binding protein